MTDHTCRSWGDTGRNTDDGRQIMACHECGADKVIEPPTAEEQVSELEFEVENLHERIAELVDYGRQLEIWLGIFDPDGTFHPDRLKALEAERGRWETHVETDHRSGDGWVAHRERLVTTRIEVPR